MTAMIKGAKGGSSKPRTPKESPDSLVSIAYARLIDLISEGEIYGLVNGSASIYLDETPASTSGGSSFSGFSWEQRTGSQDQPYLAGFPQVENEISIGVELQASAPWIRSITNTDLSAVRINFTVPRLAKQNASNGDTTGYRVDYAIDVAIGLGAYQEVLTGAFNGKTTGGYERSVRIDLPEGSGGWRVRVRRLTPNSTSSTIADTVNIKSFTEIIDAKFRYPNSAIVGVSFDAETFGGSVPRRGYHARGRIIRVPSNYDPESRTYTGIWDGTFQLAYSNNPAWIYYDLLLHPRYGLGDRIDASQVDKWGLYQIGQYCDQLVSDGQGGMEPRFVCNLYLQKRADAYKALQDIAAVFRGITYWGAGQAIVSADMPADPVYTYTNANVKNGKFSYKGSKRSTRYSAVLVGWNDPADMYRRKVEYVQDDDAVARFGVQTTEITALGCTSQGQAQRAGRWALLTNLLETETVTFSVGLDGIRARPGQIIRVADNARAGRRIGGRLSAATATVVTVDKVEGVQSGDELTCILPSGVAQTRGIVAVDGHQLTVAPAFDAAPVAQGVWAWESSSLAAQRYRIVSIGESGPLEYAITASKYVEGKHAAVDSGAIISQRPITAIPSSVQAAPQNIRAISDWMIEQTLAVTTMTILWDAAPGATRYDVEWKRGDGAWVYAGRVGGTEIDVVGIYAGTYQIRVRALNSLDVTSPWGYSEAIELAGKAGTPPAVAFLNAAPEVFGIRLEWGFPVGAEDTLRTEIQYGSTQAEQDALHLGDYAYPANTHTMTGLAAGVTFWFRARLIDRTGNIGPWSDWVMGQSSADATAILEYIAGQISETELGQHLLDRIDLIDGTGPGSVSQRVLDLQNLVDAQLEAIETQLNEITGAPEYDPLESYLEGALVKFEGALYRAIQDVQAGTPVSDAAYWEKIGDYSSIGELVSALSARMSTVETEVDQLTGTVSSQAQSITALSASVNTAEQNVQTAQQAAQDAATLAGSKGKVIVQSAAPATADRLAQNLWIDTTNNANTPKRWSGSAWVAVTDKVATDAAAAAANALSGLATKADASALQALDTRVTSAEGTISSQGQSITSLTNTVGTKTRTYRQATAPTTGLTVGDLWINTTAGQNNKLSRWNGTTWDDTTDPRIPAAATAEALNSLSNTVTQQGNTLTSQGQSITSLTNRVTSAESVNTAQAGAITSLDTRVTSTEGTLSSQASRIDGISAQINPPLAGDMGWNAGATSVLAGVWSEQSARASEDIALGQRIDTVVAQVGQNAAAISAEQTARADADGALSTRIDTAQAKADSASASVQTVSQAQATMDGKLQAMYSVKLGVTSNGQYYAAGMGLGIENTPSGMQSQVLFQADRFAVINVANGQITTPFVIQDGQVFINSAVIGDGTITMAKIASALQSTNYVAGSQGWRLDKSGTFEINGSVAGGGRMTMDNESLRVYDPNGVLRVKIGKLR